VWRARIKTSTEKIAKKNTNPRRRKSFIRFFILLILFSVALLDWFLSFSLSLPRDEDLFEIFNRYSTVLFFPSFLHFSLLKNESPNNLATVNTTTIR